LNFIAHNNTNHILEIDVNKIVFGGGTPTVEFLFLFRKSTKQAATYFTPLLRCFVNVQSPPHRMSVAKPSLTDCEPSDYATKNRIVARYHGSVRTPPNTPMQTVGNSKGVISAIFTGFRLSPSRRPVVLNDLPVSIALHQRPSHPIGRGRIAIGEIDMTGGDCDVGAKFCNARHRIGFHANGWTSAGKISADVVAADVQLVDRAKQRRVFRVELHVPIEIVRVERLDPRCKQTLYRRRFDHVSPLF
jgi:hypothetical protein